MYIDCYDLNFYQSDSDYIRLKFVFNYKEQKYEVEKNGFFLLRGVAKD